MTKQDKIKEAWGQYYQLVKNELDEHGRYSYYDDNSIKRKSKLWQFENIETHKISNLNLLIPSSIKGIENNNAWIKIESESDLPNDNGLTDYHVFNFTNQYKHIRTTYKKREVKELWEQEEITHYQPIEKPKPPIY